MECYPDALGPKVVSKLMVTRHLKELVPDSIDEGIRPVCAIAPGFGYYWYRDLRNYKGHSGEN